VVSEEKNLQIEWSNFYELDILIWRFLIGLCYKSRIKLKLASEVKLFIHR